VDDRVIHQHDTRQQDDLLASERPAGAHPAALPTFPALLQRLREDRGFSKADLAKRTSLDPSSITRFEQGARQPERETVLAIARAMVLPMAERDLLLASAGFRSEMWDDPMLVELTHLLNDTGIAAHAREEARSVVKMAVAYLKMQRLQDL
jgi:transcriptional regulator with XRE-family HTH domain